jgi:uncharacterized protein YegL
MIDSSGSITERNFELEKKFALGIIRSFNLNPGKTRVSVLIFNTVPVELFNFNNFINFKNIENILNNYEYKSGTTNTGEALKYANEKIFQEINGMRPESKLIPRAVIVLTDGVSSNKNLTLLEANQLKLRNINIKSIGVGKFNEKELIDMASSLSDVYRADDFNKLDAIVFSLTKAACTQSARVPEERALTVELPKNTYKYFKFPLLVKPDNNSNGTFLNKFTIELEDIEGASGLYYSFEHENPKSDDQYIDSTESKYEDSFISKFVRSMFSRAEANIIPDSANKKLYQITRPASGDNEVLYFSVKGLEDSNEFTIFIYNRTVTSGSKSTTKILLKKYHFLSFVLFLICLIQ